MTTGTKSLLFGVHQFIWHPITVWLAWVWLYRSVPTLKETICIIIHDWGYWGKPNMDDLTGEKHPELGAKIARYLFGEEYYDLCLHHSRHYSSRAGRQPSRLCWPDKACIMFDWFWLYIFRAMLSGEIYEYRIKSAPFITHSASNKAWYNWIKERSINMCKQYKKDKA